MNKIPRSRVFQNVGGLNPGKSVFDLSYEKKFSCDMGQLIPVLCEEVVPGDVWKIGSQILIRFQPLVAPIMHEVNVYVHIFFVPYRLLSSDTFDWESFITGGVDGDDVQVLPRWDPTGPPLENAEGSLWDFLGFPVGVIPAGAFPMSFPRDAYNLIFNEYYRDETLVPVVPLDNAVILNRAWEKDYFTSALQEQQRGTSPAIPLTGISAAEWEATTIVTGNQPGTVELNNGADARIYVDNGAPEGANNLLNALNDNTVDLSVATPFDIADFRVAFQIQKWMERNNRAGVRYTEFIQSHFGPGSAPRDERMQRPEYIGGTKSPVIISEVLQTSQTTTGAGGSPQGNLSGHGISVNNSFCGSYRVKEFGLIMGIMSVMPRTAYQQGINRQWLRETRYDFYFPEFANLSEQAITRAELYATDVEADNNTLFGYQGMYDEMRVKQSMICGQFRDTFDYWHLGRIFDNAPILNDTFVTCVPRKDIFMVPADPGLLVQFGNIVKAVRPIPFMSNPGLIDHN